MNIRGGRISDDGAKDRQLKLRRAREVRPPEVQEVGPPNPKTVAMISLAALLIVIGGLITYNVIDFSTREEGPLTTTNLFADGSTEPLVNASYAGSTVYLELPGDASLSKASLSISGALPPSRISIEVGKAPASVTAADFNMDGYPDLAAANYNEETVSVRFNHLGDGLEKGGNYPVGKGPLKVLSSDLDSDGDPDMIVLSEDEHSLTILLNDGKGSFIGSDQRIDVDPVPSDLCVMDMDGDGDMDAVVTSTATDDITFFGNDGQGHFERAFSISMGRNPLRILPMDVEKDGRMDLAVYLSQGNGTYMNRETWKQMKWLSTLTVLKNMGDGRFVEGPFEYRVKKGVNALDAADLDGDGWTDIAMANLGNKAISVLYSSGTGGFRKGPITDIDSVGFNAMDPIDIATSDLDHDGDVDIIALSKSADSIGVFYNLGNGSFAPYDHYYIGLSPTEMALTDFDLDGDLDIATSDWRGRDAEKIGNGTVSIAKNLRNGIFGTYKQYVTGNSPRGIYTMDVDGDGAAEIATANYFSSTVSILRNDGVGGFGQRQNYHIGLEPYMVVLADFDRDGYVDGASADEANFRIILLESNKQGGFVRRDPIYVDIHAYPFSLRTTDVDNDGDLDLYTSNYAQKSVTILLNDGHGDFETIFGNYTIVDLGTRMPYDAVIEDLDGDGIKDLITVNKGDDLSPTDTISIFRGGPGYKYEDVGTYKVGRQPSSATVRDFDKDGDMDIVTANTGSDSITVLQNDGNGSFKVVQTHIVGDRPQFAEAIDFDDDGWLDLAVTNTESNDLHLLRNNAGKGFKPFTTMSIGSYPYMISVRDLNGDGREEISLTSVNTGRVVVQGCYYYPSGVKIDVGADGTWEYDGSGVLTGPQEVDIRDAVSDYLKEHGDKERVRIPVRISCEGEGIVKMSDLTVVYR